MMLVAQIYCNGFVSFQFLIQSCFVKVPEFASISIDTCYAICNIKDFYLLFSLGDPESSVRVSEPL